MTCIACELETVHECPKDYDDDDPVTQDDSVNQDRPGNQDHQVNANSLVSFFCTLCCFEQN